MDMHMWVIIINNLMAFTMGFLWSREFELPVWLTFIVYFVVTTLAYMIGFYIFDIKP